MKEGWKYCELGEVYEELRTGLNPRVHFKLNTEDADGYYITVRELKGFSFQVDAKTDRVNASALKRINERSHLKIGDVLFSGTGTLGRTALVTQEPTWWNIKEGVYAITPKRNLLDSKYLIYAFHSDVIMKKIISRASGTTVKSVPMRELSKIEIPIPPLSEQQRIVSRLDASFTKIDALTKQAEESVEHAKALFQAELKELMEKKEGWEEKKLGEIAQIKGGKRVPKGCKLQTEPTEHKYIRVADFLDNGTINESNIQYISEDIYRQIKNYTISSKDVYISIAGTIGKSGIIPNTLEGSNLTENACKLVLNDGIYNRYIYYGTISPSFVEQMIAATKVSAQPKLALTRLAEIKLSIPPFSEQHQIVQTLDSLSEKIQQLQQNYNQTLANCQALKQALLKETFE